MVLLLGCQGRPPAALPEPRPFTHGVAVGDVTSDAAVIWTRAVTTADVTITISTDPQFTRVVLNATRLPDPLSDFTVKIDTRDLGPLSPGTRHYYHFESGDRRSRTGTFVTASAPGQDTPVRFAFSGDAEGGTRPHSVLATLAEEDLDFFVFLGDVIYADRPSPAGDEAKGLGEYRAKYRELRERAVVGDPQFLLDAFAATAFWTTIDDHEVVNDFAGGAVRGTDVRFADSAFVDPGRPPLINNTRRYAAGLRAFFEYMPVRDATVDAPDEPRSHGVPRLYRSFDWGRTARFIMIDARSFRDAPIEAPLNPFDAAAAAAFWRDSADSTRTMLGCTQLAWLEDQLLTARDAGFVWVFIVNQEPIQNLSVLLADDRWDGYLAERNEILKFIAEHDIRNVVWLTTDIHVTLVNDLHYVDDLAAHPTGIANPALRLPAAGSFEVVTGPIGFDPPTGVFIRPALAAVNLNLGFLMTTDGGMANALNNLLEDFGLDALGLPPERVTIHVGSPDPRRAGVFDSYAYTVVEADTQQCTFTVRGIPAYTADEAALAVSLARLGWPDALNSITRLRARDIYSFSVSAEPAASTALTP